MNLKFFLSVFLFLLCLQNSFGQIASYSFEGNLNDQVAGQNGSYNPESCCDLFGSDHCSKFTTKSGQSVCALPKVVGAGNFISESGNQSLHLDSFKILVAIPSDDFLRKSVYVLYPLNRSLIIIKDHLSPRKSNPTAHAQAGFLLTYLIFDILLSLYTKLKTI